MNEEILSCEDLKEYMKKIFILISFLFLIFIKPSFAVTGTPSASPAVSIQPSVTIKEELQNKINDLKERLATRVAEIRAQSKRAFYGEVTEKDDSTLTLTSGDKKVTVAYDENTKILLKDGTQSNEISLTNLKKGDKLVVFGTLDLDQKTIVAKNMIVQTLPVVTAGFVSKIDSNAGTVTLKDENGKTSIFDYEIKTKCALWSKLDLKTTQCGLSKIKENDFVTVRAETAKDSTNPVILRIFIVPQPSSSSSPQPKS